MKIPGRNILIVDDHISIRELIALLLSRQGHHCVTARSGAEALSQLKRTRFDAIMRDIVMPEMDGVAFTREIVSLCPQLPIMAMTAHGKEYTMETIIGAGARDFIWKPFRIDEFIVRFNRMMGEQEI